MRAFVTVRKMISHSSSDNLKLRDDMNRLKEYVDDILTDQNDINEDTTMRLELIEQSLAELQVKNSERAALQPSCFGRAY